MRRGNFTHSRNFAENLHTIDGMSSTGSRVHVSQPRLALQRERTGSARDVLYDLGHAEERGRWRTVEILPQIETGDVKVLPPQQLQLETDRQSRKNDARHTRKLKAGRDV
jgi:hypothetical protein